MGMTIGGEASEGDSKRGLHNIQLLLEVVQNLCLGQNSETPWGTPPTRHGHFERIARGDRTGETTQQPHPVLAVAFECPHTRLRAVVVLSNLQPH